MLESNVCMQQYEYTKIRSIPVAFYTNDLYQHCSLYYTRFSVDAASTTTRKFSNDFKTVRPDS